MEFTHAGEGWSLRQVVAQQLYVVFEWYDLGDTAVGFISCFIDHLSSKKGKGIHHLLQSFCQSSLDFFYYCCRSQ